MNHRPLSVHGPSPYRPFPQEPDQVPFFLLLTMHGAKELGLSIKEYFSKAENVAEGQLRMQKKIRP